MKFLKQAIYIKYILAKLSKFVQNLHTDLLRFFFTEESLKLNKPVGTNGPPDKFQVISENLDFWAKFDLLTPVPHPNEFLVN